MERLRAVQGAHARPRLIRLAWATGLTLLLSACASAPPEPTSQSQPQPQAASPVGLQASADERPFTVDAAASKIRVYAFSAGRAAALGHNHVVVAPQLQGQVMLNEKTLTQSRFALSLRLDELLLDPPEVRAQLGGGFSTPLSPEAIASTREHMLGEANLQALSYPLLQLRSLQIVGAEPKFAAQVEVFLHGQRRTQWLALTVDRQDARLSASGALVLHQSDFGIQPYSVLGGVLSVADELVVEFQLVARSSAAAARAD